MSMPCCHAAARRHDGEGKKTSPALKEPAIAVASWTVAARLSTSSSRTPGGASVPKSFAWLMGGLAKAPPSMSVAARSVTCRSDIMPIARSADAPMCSLSVTAKATPRLTISTSTKVSCSCQRCGPSSGSLSTAAYSGTAESPTAQRSPSGIAKASAAVGASVLPLILGRVPLRDASMSAASRGSLNLNESAYW